MMVQRLSELAASGQSEMEQNAQETNTIKEVLQKIGPTARAIMEAQPLNPFNRLEIIIPSRGKLFHV